MNPWTVRRKKEKNFGDDSRKYPIEGQKSISFYNLSVASVIRNKAQQTKTAVKELVKEILSCFRKKTRGRGVIWKKEEVPHGTGRDRLAWAPPWRKP